MSSLLSTISSFQKKGYKIELPKVTILLHKIPSVYLLIPILTGRSECTLCPSRVGEVQTKYRGTNLYVIFVMKLFQPEEHGIGIRAVYIPFSMNVKSIRWKKIKIEYFLIFVNYF